MGNLHITCNHKTLGLYYLLMGFYLGLFGTMLSILIRLELYCSGARVISDKNLTFYNITITLHGLVMIFFLVMPALYGGFGNYFSLLLIGAPEIVYPRINNISLLIIPLSFVVAAYSILGEFVGGCGWTMYPPLSTQVTISTLLAGLLISGVSSVITSINFFISIFYMRAVSLTLAIMNVFVWSIQITAFLLLFTLPVLTGALVMLYTDINFNTLFFDPVFGGDPVLYQHLFWFFGHPEVYILILPAFGVVSLAISYFAQSTIFGNQSMILAMTCIAILGSYVWGHHMYAVAMDSDTIAYFTATTMMISLPTGTKIFNWLCTFMGNNLSVVNSVTFLANGFLLLFTLGGVTGVILGNGGVDVALHDTYYVVAHFHFVLSLGAVTAIIAGFLLLSPRFLGTSNYTTSSLSVAVSVLVMAGFLLTFTPMHFLGFNVMARRIPDYPNSFYCWNFLASIGSGMTLFSSVVVKSLKYFNYFILKKNYWYCMPDAKNILIYKYFNGSCYKVPLYEYVGML